MAQGCWCECPETPGQLYACLGVTWGHDIGCTTHAGLREVQYQINPDPGRIPWETTKSLKNHEILEKIMIFTEFCFFKFCSGDVPGSRGVSWDTPGCPAIEEVGNSRHLVAGRPECPRILRPSPSERGTSPELISRKATFGKNHVFFEDFMIFQGLHGFPRDWPWSSPAASPDV